VLRGQARGGGGICAVKRSLAGIGSVSCAALTVHQTGTACGVAATAAVAVAHASMFWQPGMPQESDESGCATAAGPLPNSRVGELESSECPHNDGLRGCPSCANKTSTTAILFITSARIGSPRVDHKTLKH